MSRPPARPSRFEPTWRRLGAGTAGLFLVLVAFLAGRMRAGADSALATSRSTAGRLPPAQVAPPQSQGDDPSYGGYGSGPDDPYAPYGDGSGGGGTQSAPTDPNPPATHAS
jgi:hypothetical protein